MKKLLHEKVTGLESTVEWGFGSVDCTYHIKKTNVNIMIKHLIEYQEINPKTVKGIYLTPTRSSIINCFYSYAGTCS